MYAAETTKNVYLIVVFRIILPNLEHFTLYNKAILRLLPAILRHSTLIT